MLFDVNLSEGLIYYGLTSEDGRVHRQIVGGYSRNLRKVIILLPYTLENVKIPKELNGFDIIQGRSDNIGLTYWTVEGYKECNEI